MTPLELQLKKNGCDKEIVQEIVSEWLQKVSKRYTQNTRLEFQHWKGKNVIRLRLCERIEGSCAQKTIRKLTTNMSNVQAASNDVACTLLFFNDANEVAEGSILGAGRVT